MISCPRLPANKSSDLIISCHCHEPAQHWASRGAADGIAMDDDEPPPAAEVEPDVAELHKKLRKATKALRQADDAAAKVGERGAAVPSLAAARREDGPRGGGESPTRSR